MGDEYRVRTALFTGLDAETLYALLRLRVDVFVVEQRCVPGDGFTRAGPEYLDDGVAHVPMVRAGEHDADARSRAVR